MSYNALVTKSIDTAFRLLGDLAILVTFSKKNNASFNFSTMDVNTVQGTTKQVRCIKTTKKIREKIGDGWVSSERILLLTQSSNLLDLSPYDTASVDGVTYNIAKPIEDDGFVLTITLQR